MPFTPAPLPRRGEGIRERGIYNRREIYNPLPSGERIKVKGIFR
jgi:hypothetical protein